MTSSEGELAGEAHGQMLAAMTGVTGSAAYVALDYHLPEADSQAR